MTIITVTTADTPECTAPMTKYGAKMVLCQPGTEVTAKSQDTMECTETKIGRMIAESSRPATVWIRH